MSLDELQEQLAIEDEMNEDGDDSDSDEDLLIQALRDRLQAAAYLQALGQKLPFGFHFGLINILPQIQDTFKKAPEDGGRKELSNFNCTEKNCEAKFSSWSMMNAHLNGHRMAQINIKEEEQEDDGREEGEIPQGSHELPLPQGCPLCGDKEALKDLNNHVRIAHGIDGVVCPHCGKILSKACTLNRHIEQVHLNLQIHKPAKCEECGKMFSKKGHLDRHVKTIHMGIKDNSEPCPYCGKVFSTKSSLEPHIDMVHRGVRRACPECGKVLSDLWKHMRTVHGLYRRRVKIPKESDAGSKNSSDLASPSNSPSEPESSPVKAKSSSPSSPASNNNSASQSNNNTIEVKKVAASKTGSKNKRKSSPPVKVKMTFNNAKIAKKVAKKSN